jgi:hypothetical protein
MAVFDEWTAWQLDNAVAWFGNYIENKLMETGADKRPRYTLEELLDDKPADKAAMIKKLVKIFGMLET